MQAESPSLFLDKIFQELQQKKTNSESKHIPMNTVYQGYKTIPIQQLEQKQPYQKDRIQGSQIWSKGSLSTIHFYQESCPLSYQAQNGFFSAFHEAYIQHGDVKITPDDVWLTIMLFFSKYVDEHANQIRKAFVHHEGKLQLKVQVFGESKSSWKQFLDKMIIQIKNNTAKKVTEVLQCNFTSSNEFSRLLSTAMIMNTYKKYFEYTRQTFICGIQNIHMGGTLEDWENLSSKLAILKQFDVNGQLRRYVYRLLPVIDQFIETYKGNAHLEFWNNIYHERKEPFKRAYSPSMHINGWIIRFFTADEQMGDQVSVEEIDIVLHEVNMSSNKKRKLHLLGGCRGVSVDDKRVYRPHFSLAVVEKMWDPNDQ